MCIRDSQVVSPLALKGMDLLGERFVDLSEPYCKNLQKRALSIAHNQQIQIHQGVYAAVVGPQLETAAEYRYLKIIGADAVGMSTVPEVIVARHMKIKCFGISVITDLGVPGKIKFVTIIPQKGKE